MDVLSTYHDITIPYKTAMTLGLQRAYMLKYIYDLQGKEQYVELSLSHVELPLAVPKTFAKLEADGYVGRAYGCRTKPTRLWVTDLGRKMIEGDSDGKQ